MQSQKNEVFKALIHNGLDPNNFNWSEINSRYDLNNIISGLYYKKTSFHFYFEVYGSAKSDIAIFSPGQKKLIEEVSSGNWNMQMICVIRWIDNLIRELNEPDLWEGLKIFQSQKTEIGKQDTPLSDAEIPQIEKGIRELKEYITKYLPLNKEETELINSQFDFLNKTLKQQSKKSIYFFIFNILFAIYNKNTDFFNQHAINLFGIVQNMFSEILKALPVGM